MLRHILFEVVSIVSVEYTTSVFRVVEKTALQEDTCSREKWY
jgi:hypothetical protein